MQGKTERYASSTCGILLMEIKGMVPLQLKKCIQYFSWSCYLSIYIVLAGVAEFWRTIINKVIIHWFQHNFHHHAALLSFALFLSTTEIFTLGYMCVLHDMNTWWADSILPWWFFRCCSTSDMEINTIILNGHQSASAAFSQAFNARILCVFLHSGWKKNKIKPTESPWLWVLSSILFHNWNRVQGTSPVALLPQPPGILAHMDGGLSEAF